VGGLANRLRVLVSGLALAERSDRTYRYVWPRTRTCGAAFRELFVNRWPVEDVETLDPELARHRIVGWGFRQAVALLDDPRPDLVLGVGSWLVPTGPRWPTLHDRCAAHLAALAPIEPVAGRVAAFRARHFRSVMIGVHLRRGDFLRERPDVVGNTAKALAVVDRFLAAAPDAGILLCTDDGAMDGDQPASEGLASRFAARYGTRVVSTVPRSLDRRTVEAIQDALVDFQLLRTTQMVVGTEGSSFSRLAVFGRDVPYVAVVGSTARYAAIDRAARLTGVHWLVRMVYRAVYGHHQSFPKALARFRQTLRQRS
jgi:hypothetical protein